MTVAPSWPPELYDADATRWMLGWLESHPDDGEWGFYYFVEADMRQAIGVGGDSHARLSVCSRTLSPMRA